jgi:arylsulfatase A
MTVRATSGLLLALLAWTAFAAERPPNFIIILTDDLGYGDLGVCGHPTIRTPRIDRMAAEGVRLSEFYSPAPSCTPARAALLTGHCPLRSGMTRVLIPLEKWGLPQSEITLAEALKARGYTTGIVGKWHLGGRKPYWPTEHGFDMFYGVLHSNDMARMPLTSYPAFNLYDGAKVVESPARQRLLTRHYTERAVRFNR